MIRLEGLTRKFNGLTAVDNLTFEVKEGEIFGLLGPNGAGKTTTVRMLCCLIRPTSGRAFIGDYEVGRDAIKIREIVGLLPESPGLYGELSAYRNLEFYAKLYGVPKEKREENIERFLRMMGLWERRNDLVGTFSKGMQQKIAIARSMVHEPKVLFLDEPTAALAPDSAKVVRDFILELKHKKRTIFICTHNLYEAERICDRVAIINTRLLALGSPAQLQREFGSGKTEIQLKNLGPRIVRAVKKVKGVLKVEVSGEKLLVQSKEPDTVNPKVVEVIVKNGGKVLYVTRGALGLEEVYLKMVGKNEV
ncbi:MAG: ABC transporter ATP-binding protein [Candidatus Hadarchaeum sp.]|uniref:ABC transporter ATP-binding protein n=1 Tax=Candidatus Hadarchaeum sp. TaxID=2883567 RepID=UPI003D0DF478